MRGVKVKYLFNLFDYWGTIVTSRDNVKTLKDLEGKELAGARSTTNYQMSEFFEKRQGVDLSKIKVVNTAPPGLISYAIADRADAIQIWEPAYTLMIDQEAEHPHHRPQHRQDLEGLRRRRRRFPISASARTADWADANPDKVQKLYTIYKLAVEWVQKNPDEAAPLLAKGAPPEELKAVAAMIKSNERLAMKLTKAGEIRKDIEAVYKAGMEINYLPSMPSDALDLRQAAEVIAFASDDAQSSRQAVLPGVRQHPGAAGRLADRVVFLSALSVPAGAGRARAHRADSGQLARAVAGAGDRGADFRRARRRVRSGLACSRSRSAAIRRSRATSRRSWCSCRAFRRCPG